jgi:hypothetical protein
MDLGRPPAAAAPDRQTQRRRILDNVNAYQAPAERLAAPLLRASEQSRPDVAKARIEWREKQPNLNPGKLVFIDETWTKTNMTRLYGRAPRGHRVVDAVPHGHWKT